jgi:LacI family transcriptional regulator
MTDIIDASRRQRPVTIKEVAERAGVSIATVSRVVNGSHKVDPQLAERVREAIASLKYRPNRAARALAGNHSALLGLLVTDIQNPFFMDMMRGVEEVALQNGYLLVVCNTAEEPEREEQYIEILAEEAIAGVIIVPSRERLEVLNKLKARKVPIVAVDRRIHDQWVDTVLINNVAAAKEAVEHLIAHGYRRIGIITGPRTATTANERLLGYRQALQEAGIEPEVRLEHRGAYHEETGKKGIQKLLRIDPPVEAILIANNRLTVGALRELHAYSKRVPEDIVLVAFDEIRWAIPDLTTITTVKQPAYELGRTAAIRLLQRLQQPDIPRQEIILQHQLLQAHILIHKELEKLNDRIQG